MLFILLVVGALSVRLVWLQGYQPAAYAASAQQQRTQKIPLIAHRGSITDRNGQLLATNVDARVITANPKLLASATCLPGRTVPCTPAEIATVLAPLLKTTVGSLTEQLDRKEMGFVYLAKGLDPAVGKAVGALDLLGIGVDNESIRLHPGGDLAANVIGFTDPEGTHGLAGIESAWGSVLAGKDGTQTAQFDGSGRMIPTGQEQTVPAVSGQDVELTLDRDLQWYAQQLLTAKIAETQAVNGSVVVMDPRTGEVLAMATGPTFNPDDRSKASAEDLRNPAIQDSYEPGSVNKIITAAAALEAGLVTPDTVITVPPTYNVGSHVVHDAEAHGLEHLTFTGVLAKSSNIGTVQVAQELGAQRVYDALVRFGFGVRTGIGLPGESRGILPAVADWSGSSIATIPIGQGVAATAIQVASVYATVANGGVRVAPSIVRATIDAAGQVTPVAAPEQHRVISAQVASTLALMLENVVTAEGTAPLAAVPGYRVAGKTGTAQRVVNGRYAPGNYTSSFVGFAPADAPRLVVAVVLQGTGKNGYFGGSTAGPVFKDVMSFGLNALRIAPTGTTAPHLRLDADKAD